LSGLQSAAKRRKKQIKHSADICNGPGKVTQVLAIDRSYNSHPLFESGGLELRVGTQPASIERTARIGINYANESDKSALLRFIAIPSQNC
jgi:DNA-3-methyladenine glycosylase